MSTPSARTLEADALHWIRERASDADVSRYRLARDVCERFDWRDTRGRYQEMACRKRLGELHQRGLIVLPPKRRAPAAGTPLSPREIVPIEAALSELGEIKLLCVTTAPVALRDELSRIWRSLMQAHPLGGGPLCGAQLRYLIRCERGWLGALAFSAGAYRLNARDAWLGWDATERQANLERIVCNSRFLILPEVRVPHLASHVLAQIDKRLGADWQTRYGYTPWLIETFVDAPHTGVCYRAANWIEIGSTRGRGRNDAQHRHDRGRKKVFVKLLRPEHFPRRQAPHARADWAEAEFGGINLEPRLVRRSIEIARDFFARPSAQIPEACETWARTKAAYRFFDHPKAKMQTLLAGHYQATHQRCRAEPIVLAVCDSSALNYSAHPLTCGMGPIGSRKEGPIGLWLHETLAFTPSGVPLGLLDVQCWARDVEAFGQKHRRKQRPIEDKESFKWIKSWQAVCQAQAATPQSQLVMVADRESDLYELFAQTRGQTAQLLVRAQQSRQLVDEELRLWPHLQASPIVGEVEVHAGRQGDQPARSATLSVRHAEVTLRPPQGQEALGPVTVWAVWAKEAAPPAGVEPLDWMLLTTVPTTTLVQASERLAWYAKRWGIEIYHRILKSGCNIEDRQLGTADRLEACLAIDLVVAWRVMHLVHLNREVPNLPATVYFEDMQWQALLVYASKNPKPPAEPPTLYEAVRLLGRMGGHLGRKLDAEPGAEAIWTGLQRLDDLTEMYRIMANPPPTPPPRPSG